MTLERRLSGVTEQIRRHQDDQRPGSRALAESLHLQESVRDRDRVAQKQRGRRRKGTVIDLDQRALIKPRGRRMLFAILVIESIIAVIAVAVLIAYLWFEGDALQ